MELATDPENFVRITERICLGRAFVYPNFVSHPAPAVTGSTPLQISPPLVQFVAPWGKNLKTAP